MRYDRFENLYRSVEATSLLELKEDLLKSAVRYARIRVDWMLSDSEGRMALEDHRKIAHNAFIDACNILARNMAKRGESASWRERLGDHRVEIGNFACFIHLFLGLGAA